MERRGVSTLWCTYHEWRADSNTLLGVEDIEPAIGGTITDTGEKLQTHYNLT